MHERQARHRSTLQPMQAWFTPGSANLTGHGSGDKCHTTPTSEQSRGLLGEPILQGPHYWSRQSLERLNESWASIFCLSRQLSFKHYSTQCTQNKTSILQCRLMCVGMCAYGSQRTQPQGVTLPPCFLCLFGLIFLRYCFGAHQLGQAGQPGSPRDLPVSASSVLGFRVCVVLCSFFFFFTWLLRIKLGSAHMRGKPFTD